MKLKDTDLQQVNARKALIKQRHNEFELLSVELQVLRREAQLYNSGLLKDYGCDPKKTYRVEEDGTLTELENENSKVDTEDEKKPADDKSTGGDKKPAKKS